MHAIPVLMAITFCLGTLMFIYHLGQLFTSYSHTARYQRAAVMLFAGWLLFAVVMYVILQ